jgi:polysaccharide biosynthesis/export protein
MQSTPFRRTLAVLLSAQPVFWTSNVAQAQALPQPGGQSVPSSPPLASPMAPTEPEVVRAERPVLTVPVPGAPPIDELIDPDKYVCGPGDVLELNFWGMQNFKLRATVDLEGRAFVARIGYLSMQGKTLSEARRKMRESVARYFPRLSFDVTLAEPRTFLVQVVDDVARPGSYPARAIDRVATLIGRAGGFGPNASKRRIEIRRLGGTVLHADLLLYAFTGDVKHNPYLLDGDVVRVPFEDLAASIDGAVNRPGRYELIGARDLEELVELGGGLAPSATQHLPISLVRRLPDDRQDQQLVDFTADGALPAVAIQRESSVRIPSFSELQRSVMVIGAIAGAAPPAVLAATGTTSLGTAARVAAVEEVSATRRLPFVQGDSVRTLLERIGGVGPLADLTGSYILRDGKSLPVDLYALLMLRDLRADRPVELGDTLVVPFKRQGILVEGAVFAPGGYPYHPAYRVEEYLALAGGRNRFAQSLSDVKLVTPNGEMKDYAPDLKVEPGSTLVVPERSFSRSEIVQIVIGAASVLISGVAVILAARK